MINLPPDLQQFAAILRPGPVQPVAAVAITFGLCIVTWILALWLTGARLDARLDNSSGLVALYLTQQTGASFQCSGQGCSVWIWRGEDNRRLSPGG